ncbi:Carbohydrate sulfotransferase 1 [Araneus ventricosus]|uniref:Carbohydrate sulfotransferase 1 n=1 Tax=Araneus ventricosus TaxID=182803 RepID=A0A4Y2RBM3_ARAVE|nr:Carbohydrate sulfotransferase 1 [Araneus ventricosus]
MRHRRNDSGPIHVLLIAYARTGSSFVGDLLQSLPNTFYHFEPLHFLGNPVLNDSFQEARALLDKVFRCNVSSIDGFLKWQKKHKGYMKFKRSFNYWKECSKKNFCYNGSYIDNYCRKRGTIVVKTIRLKLPDAAELFTTHPHLNLKIIYLTRDPRGSINSRTKFPVSQWCKRDPMCINPNHFCSALGEDLKIVCSLSKERPEDFMVLRYEDLSIDPFATTTRLVEFLGLQSIPPDTQAFLNSHTSVIGNVREKYRPQGLDYPYSTFRNSSITAMSWRSQMSFRRVTLLQTTCQTALTGLGYYSYSTAASLRSNLNFDTNVDEAVRAFCSAN